MQNALGKLLSGMLCHVNLIPVNEIKENSFKRSSKKAIDDFSEILRNNGIEVTTRREMGSDINAACGQLRRSYIETQKIGENKMVGLVSDVGLRRKLNEDSACYLERADFKIYVVADGMGGHNAGEVASKMAAEQIVQYIDENYSLECEETLISNAIKAANEDIYKIHQKTNDKLNGMGTTVTAALVTPKFIYIANVGDKLLYGF